MPRLGNIFRSHGGSSSGSGSGDRRGQNHRQQSASAALASSSSSGGGGARRGGTSRAAASTRGGFAGAGGSHGGGGSGGHGNSAGQGGGSRTHHSALPKFLRGTGSLGLSKSELDKMCKPSGLYDNCSWDDRAVRRLIGDGKLAARLRGHDARTDPGDRECPICFLHYSSINVTGCCKATVCTECYLQIRPQRQKDCQCPFCNNPKMSIQVARSMGDKDVARREEEEQRVIEAQIRARGAREEEEGKAASVASGDGSAMAATEGVTPPSTPPTSGFGSSLNSHDFVQRARSHSSGDQSISEHSDLSELALTPDDRRAIEADMANQTSHSSWLRVEEEAERRRNQNERDYYRAHSGRLLARALGGGGGDAPWASPAAAGSAGYDRAHADRMLLRAHGIPVRGMMGSHRMASDSRLITSSSGGLDAAALFGGRGSASRGSDVGLAATTGGITNTAGVGGGRDRDWNQIVDAFEGGGNGEVQSIDDLVVIEAAILLSMEEEAQRRRRAEAEGGGGGGAGAASASAGGANAAFDAPGHARAGFPLLQSALGGGTAAAAAAAAGSDAGSALGTSIREEDEDDDDNNNDEEEDDGGESLPGMGSDAGSSPARSRGLPPPPLPAASSRQRQPPQQQADGRATARATAAAIAASSAHSSNQSSSSSTSASAASRAAHEGRRPGLGGRSSSSSFLGRSGRFLRSASRRSGVGRPSRSRNNSADMPSGGGGSSVDGSGHGRSLPGSDHDAASLGGETARTASASSAGGGGGGGSPTLASLSGRLGALGGLGSLSGLGFGRGGGGGGGITEEEQIAMAIALSLRDQQQTQTHHQQQTQQQHDSGHSGNDVGGNGGDEGDEENGSGTSTPPVAGATGAAAATAASEGDSGGSRRSSQDGSVEAGDEGGSASAHSRSSGAS